jgi:RNase adaptor protein for sRNA GlmZ degradation
MAKFRDFGSPAVENRETISFKLFDEEFFCVGAMPGKVLLDLVSKSGSDSASDQAAVITDFFSSVLVEESLLRFNELVVDKDRVVTTETLGEITGWLIEQYSARPEEQPEV